MVGALEACAGDRSEEPEVVPEEIVIGEASLRPRIGDKDITVGTYWAKLRLPPGFRILRGPIPGDTILGGKSIDQGASVLEPPPIPPTHAGRLAVQFNSRIP